MQYTSAVIIFLLLSLSKSENIAFLETAYNHLSQIYENYLNKRIDYAHLVTWKDLSQPRNMMPLKSTCKYKSISLRNKSSCF